jgi:hypothetical protein
MQRFEWPRGRHLFAALRCEIREMDGRTIKRVAIMGLYKIHCGCGSDPRIRWQSHEKVEILPLSACEGS